MAENSKRRENPDPTSHTSRWRCLKFRRRIPLAYAFYFASVGPLFSAAFHSFASGIRMRYHSYIYLLINNSVMPCVVDCRHKPALCPEHTVRSRFQTTRPSVLAVSSLFRAQNPANSNVSSSYCDFIRNPFVSSTYEKHKGFHFGNAAAFIGPRPTPVPYCARPSRARCKASVHPSFGQIG